MREIRIGIIGCGLMGRECASAIARWCDVLDVQFRPVLRGICDTNGALLEWYRHHFPSLVIATDDYRHLLERDDIDVLYCPVPHHLHQAVYVDVIRAGKHLMGEKPFGIDIVAARGIVEESARHPRVFVRCSSEFPFTPGAQRVIEAIEARRFGRIIEVNTGFLHSSDLDPEKAINWKRIVELNGEYGCLGDLGMHALHVPLRAGWYPHRVFAHLNKIVRSRPDGSGGTVPCLTWDNGSVYCDVVNPADGEPFPMTLKTYRIAPGETNTWFIEILGTRYSIRFSTRNPKSLQYMEYSPGGAQTWQEENLGHETLYKTIRGSIFEFGFADAILQMWAAFLDELVNGHAPYGCMRPGEVLETHKLFRAALESQRTRQAVPVD